MIVLSPLMALLYGVILLLALLVAYRAVSRGTKNDGES